MTSGMFLLGDDGRLVGLTEQGYDSEDLLQHLLASYPDLLAGDQMEPSAPRRWLLVRREAGVADALGAADRWSVDHLFLDQDGVPTLVEVKRSSDTRIRREVVGQMLDYAANAVAYLPVTMVRGRFEARCEKDGLDPEATLLGALGADLDVEGFWQRVGTNLEAGRIRLVFVADVIPPELRRIVEYLNRQMDPTEVYAVEVKQFVSGTTPAVRTLVPRLLGRHERKEGAAPTVQWDLPGFERDAEERLGRAGLDRARRLLRWAEERHLYIYWSMSTRRSGWVPIHTDAQGVRHQLFECWADGTLEVYFQHLGAKGPFVDETLRRELLTRLNAIDGVAIPESALSRRPRLAYATLPDSAIAEVLRVWDWVLEVLGGRV